MSTFFYVPQYFTTQLSVAGGIDDTQTTGIVLQDISGVDDTKPGIIALTWSNPIDTTKIEYIFYTSINSSTKELQGVTRGQEGYSAKSHLNGATVAWPLSKSHINNIPDSTTTFSNKTLISPKINEDVALTATATQLNAVGAGGVTSRLASKVITATRDLTAASGDVPYTGVGFTPSCIIALVNIDSNQNASLGIGFCDSSRTDNTVGQYTGGFLYQGSEFITVESESSQSQLATVKSFDADGFTLTWTKQNSPTGTAKIIFLCFR